ncbi:MAG: transglycosylase domain-containing protein [Saprospiraceae bacterium]|nr:transglycosylase domain-containing protein [Saprospiraceae bacterium]
MSLVLLIKWIEQILQKNTIQVFQPIFQYSLSENKTVVAAFRKYIMLENIKNIWTTYIIAPLSKLLSPLTKLLAGWFEPIGQLLHPYKERFDESWAGFFMDHPRLAIWLRRGTKVLAALYAFYFVFAIGLFGEIPTVEELKDLQTLNTSEVYTADSVLIGKFYLENRKDIRYEDLPQHLVDALVSEEDKRYWSHSGVDFRALGRVFYYSLLKGDERSGGGSTLSQQLAKNIYGRKKYFMFSTPINKVKEMLIARRLERAYDKQNLLALYLNTVPFGGNVFGVEMASKRFFNKTAKELKVEEAAVLVGMLQKNTRYNPRRDPKASMKRRNEVLNSMVENGKLDKKTAETLKKDTIKLDYQPVLNRDAMGSYFKDYLRTLMPKLLEPYKKEDGTAYDIYKDGLKIYTSVESQLQLLAEEAVTERMNELQKNFDNHWSGDKWWGDDKWLEDAMRNSPRWKALVTDGWKDERIRKHFMTEKIPMTVFTWENGKPAEDERTMTPLDSIKYYFRQLNTGFMVTDAKNGLIKAWVGGTDFNFFQYDHVRAKRQVGSTFKPIVYAKAIQAGIRPCEYISNQFTAYLPDHTTKSGYDLTEAEKADQRLAWAPRNSNEDYTGSYSLEGALTNSVNVITANLINRIGYGAVAQLAKDMGVTSDMQQDLSIALGTTDISLYDMMKVYGTFAARGRRPELMPVLKVATRDGKIIVDFTKDINPNKWQQVLSPDHADMMTKMMKSVVNDGTAGRLRYKYEVNNDIAGKTGTTQNHADGWFMCYTPNIVCGAWVGGTIPAVRFRDMSYGQGAYMALPVCALFLQKLYKHPSYAALKNEKFLEPAKWVKDSMNCDPKIYSQSELEYLDSMRRSEQVDTSAAPIELTPSQDKFPEEVKQQEDKKNDDHDLRSGSIQPATLPKPSKTTTVVPQNKLEQKPLKGNR